MNIEEKNKKNSGSRSQGSIQDQQQVESCSNPENICIEDLGDQKNHKYDAKNYWESQKFAFSGLKLILRNERNFRIQLFMSVCAVIVGLILGISHRDWVALVIVISLVLISEAFNSVVEAVCDTISQDYRINIKYAKDVSAGAVMVSAIVSLIAGIFIFTPYLWEIAQNLLPI